jgi:hypothetical protein
VPRFSSHERASLGVMRASVPALAAAAARVQVCRFRETGLRARGVTLMNKGQAPGWWRSLAGSFSDVGGPDVVSKITKRLTPLHTLGADARTRGLRQNSGRSQLATSSLVLPCTSAQVHQ